MVNNFYKFRVTNLIVKAREKGLVKSYSQFCETECGKKKLLAKDEINYYTSIEGK